MKIKEDIVMKDVSKKIMRVVKAVALDAAKINANTSCVCILHQPKAPTALKALKK